MSTRRKFIKDSVLVATGSLISSSSLGGFFIGKKPKVIIIGAGFAGLAAAYYLHKKNIEFIILEARNRIGGRVFSYPIDPTENLVIELGAEWVGNSHHRMRDLSGELGLQLINNQFDSHLIYKGKYYKKGEWDYSETWKAKFKSLIDNYHRLTTVDRRALDRLDWWRYLVNEGCTDRDLDIRELFDSTDFGESIRQVSAFAALSEYAESDEKDE